MKNVLPDTIFGVDTDDLLAYVTTKKVYVRDRKVGCAYYVLIIIILGWIVGGQILWQNQHFLLKDVSGIQHVRSSHPTVNGCDPELPDCQSSYMPLEELPYCKQYEGKSWHGAGPCKYEDIVAADPEGTVDNKIFFPTAVETITEKLVNGEYVREPGSDCLQGGNYLCTKSAGKDDQFHYVADVKHFTLQLTSSYERDGLHGTSLESSGFYSVCPSQMRSPEKTRRWKERLFDKGQCAEGDQKDYELPCQPGMTCTHMQKFDAFETSGVNDGIEKLKKKGPDMFKGRDTALARRKGGRAIRGGGHLGVSSGSNATDSNQPGAYQSRLGDVFTVVRLLELAGTDIDNDYNIDGWTSRQSGTVLEVTVKYHNLYPFLSSFGYTPVRYTYEAKELPMPYVSRRSLADVQPADYPKTRVHEVRYGIMVWFRVGGSLGFFSSMYLIVMLTAALGLISVATTVTDLVAQKVHPNFFHLKYEVSPDFSDLWVCETCGYANIEEDTHCQGVPEWMCPKTTAKCGVARCLSTEPAEKPADGAAS